MKIKQGAKTGLRFYAVTESGDIDITDILNPEIDLGDLGAWANSQGIELAFRTPRRPLSPEKMG